MMGDKTDKKTFVEEGTEFIGTMRASCPVVVRGSVEGDLEAPAVSVADTGRVTGNVKAKSVRSEGELAGSIEADEISLAGKVKSNTVIRAKTLEVKLASDRGRIEVTFGDCIVDVGDVAAVEARLDEPAVASASASSDASGDEGDGKSKRSRKRKDGPEEDASTETVLEANAAEPTLPV